MAFSKTFPRTIQGSSYPLWEEVYLTEEEERQAEECCKQENFQLMDEALREARMLAIKHGINEDLIRTKLAIALFEKRASHVVFWKESLAKDKFDGKHDQSNK
ncbi:hypothetical protein J4210_00605 [Candidatus Woesearchaeota archaeon]|nr:hypothetical protein [Candidatus Woesearchaeota archaeon]